MAAVFAVGNIADRAQLVCGLWTPARFAVTLALVANDAAACGHIAHCSSISSYLHASNDNGQDSDDEPQAEVRCPAATRAAHQEGSRWLRIDWALEGISSSWLT